MSAYQHIQVEREDHLFLVTINRPEVLNALNPDTNFDLAAAFETALACDIIVASESASFGHRSR